MLDLLKTFKADPDHRPVKRRRLGEKRKPYERRGRKHKLTTGEEKTVGELERDPRNKHKLSRDQLGHRILRMKLHPDALFAPIKKSSAKLGATGRKPKENHPWQSTNTLISPRNK